MDIEWITPGALCVDKRGNEYSIITIAKDIQTGDNIVVYSQSFGEMETLCCPLDAFCISFTSQHEIKRMNFSVERMAPLSAEEKMMSFFDTDDFSKKIKLLKDMHILGQLTDGIIDNLAATLDFVVEEGDLDLRYDQLLKCLETRARFEGTRLRF